MQIISRLIGRLTALRCLVAAAALLVPAAHAQYTPPASHRVDLNFNHDWRFIRSDVANAQTTGFNDAAWTAVSLPHTWNDDKFREWIFPSNDAKADPLRPSGTYYGIGWYRKHFTIDPAYAGRKVILEFQGIGRAANFYVNGVSLGYHENGVGPCGLDVTGALNPAGTDNVIAIQVNNDENYVTKQYGVKLPYGQPFNPNFGGLNRDVTMHISDTLYQTLPLYRNLGTLGTYVYPTGIDTLHRTAGLTVNAEVQNDSGVAKTATLEAVIVDASGNQVGSTLAADAQTLAAGARTTFTTTGSLTGIHFWAPDYPYLYQVYTIVKVGGAVVDVYKTPLGVRKVSFSSTYGLQINGHPLYLNGYAPRCSMEWPAVGVPVDWMNEFDFALMKASHANFVRPMHIAPRRVQVEAADKYGIIMVVPAANNEGDDTDPNIWQERLDIMRDVTVYFRNNPSVLFYEGCNQILTAQHMQDMLNVRLTYDPSGGRLAGLRSNDDNVTQGIREYSCTMDGSGHSLTTPLWDAEYARGEAPRRVWDNYTPMLNPRWNGASTDPTPATGTIGDTAHKYLLGGYFYIAGTYHQALGLNSGNGDFIGDYLTVIPQAGANPTHAYFRLQNSEDMVLQNLAKYYARYANSVFIQPSATNTSQGVMVGGGKIIWSDSVTDGRMHDTEVTRVSGAVDGARLPKEVFYGLQVAHNSQPQVYVVGHWNYPAGTTKTVYVASNTAQVQLQTFDANGALLHDYGFGTKNFFPASILPTGGDQINNYVFAFPDVAWQPGSIKAIGYNNGSITPVATHTKSTAGAPVTLRVTPVTGPNAWYADGLDVAMFDVEVVDAAGNRCLTYEDAVTFSCTGPGTFLGGYNSGIRYSTNLNNLTSGYKLNVEAGLNRVFVRATRTAGTFTLTAAANGLATASASATSTVFNVTNGLTSTGPQKYVVPLGTEPTPVAEGIAPPPPANSPNPAPEANAANLHYSGGHADQATLVENVQPGQLAYMDSTTITLPADLPGYLIGGEFIRPFLDDAGETSSTDQYQFDLTRYSYVYQLIDAANGMPNNNNNDGYQWTRLAGTLTVNGRAMNIYKSRLMKPYENVYLAVNGHENAAPGFNPASNMYLVFIVSAEQELQKPGDTVTASTTQNNFTAALAVDGDPSTRWNAASAAMPQTFDLDLGANVLVGGYEINWYLNASRYYKYQVQISPNGTDYAMSLDMSGNATTGAHEFRVPAIYAGAGRYVRITVSASSGGGWAAISEIKVRGVLAGASAAAVPVITSALADAGKAGYAYSYQIAASGSPTGFAAQGLPAGFTLNGVTGVISGVTAQSGVIPITVSAVNGAGTGSAILQLTMAAPPPVPAINSLLSVSTQAGVAMAAYTATATNMNYTPSSFSATLPAGLGLAFNTATGVLSGTPKYPGAYTIPLSATNPGGTGPVANLQLTVTPNGNPPTVTGGSVAATVGTAFSYQVSATGSPTLYGATNLPPGLSIATGTGIISGTPTAAGSYSTIVLSATNAGGPGTANLTITVTQNPNAPSITSALTASGNVNSPFTYTITATNSPTGYTATPLPAGLTLNATTGLITGAPTAQATTNVALKATNASGSDAKTLVITIGAAITPPVVNSPANAVGAVGAYFTYQITATNSPTGFTATPLPAGLTVNATTGLISGTPTAAGTTSVSLGALNGSGTGTGKTLTIVISSAGADINLALNRPAFASSVNGTNVATLAVDGNATGTRWESVQGNTADPSWWYVDLGGSRPLHSVVITWQNAGGLDYLVQTTNNDPTVEANWAAAAPEITDGKAGETRTITLNGGVSARYVRMSGQKRTGVYGYSIFEFQVLGTPPVLPPPGSPSAAPGTGTGQVVVSWSAVAGATSYAIQRSANAAFGYATVGTVSAPTHTYTDSDPALRAGMTYYYQVIAVNAQGTSLPGVTATGTPAVPPGLAGWRYRYFGAAGLAPTMANGAADNASFMQDGVTNLMKYALGLDPTANCYASSVGALPVVQPQVSGGATYLALTFTGTATDVTYAVQASSDLGSTWQTLGTYSGAGAVGTFTVMDTQPMSASGKRFMRLQVTVP